MANVIFISNGAESGKSSILIALLNLLTHRGVELLPFKPLTITDDLVMKDGRALPWSLATQLEFSDLEYQEGLNPFLLKPQDQLLEPDCLMPDQVVELYRHGRLEKELVGREFLDQLDDYKRELAAQISKFTGKNMIVEGMGDAFNLSHPELKLANLEMIQMLDAAVILTVDIGKEKSVQQLTEAIQLCDQMQIQLAGIILTKFKQDAPELAQAREVIQQNQIRVVGEIPYNTEAEGSNVTVFADWIRFVEDHSDLDYLESLFGDQKPSEREEEE